MTTNGVNLRRKIDEVKAAGLTHLNISIDSLVPAKFDFITRWENGLDVVLEVSLNYSDYKKGWIGRFQGIEAQLCFDERIQRRWSVRLHWISKRKKHRDVIHWVYALWSKLMEWQEDGKIRRCDRKDILVISTLKASRWDQCGRLNIFDRGD